MFDTIAGLTAPIGVLIAVIFLARFLFSPSHLRSLGDLMAGLGAGGAVIVAPRVAAAIVDWVTPLESRSTGDPAAAPVPAPAPAAPLPDLSSYLSNTLIIMVGVVLLGLLGAAGYSAMRNSRARSVDRAELRARAQEKEQARVLRRQAAIDIIDAVREDYGEKLCDITYVIDNNALFQAARPLVKDFTQAYALVTDADLTLLDLDTVEKRAAALRTSYDAAVADAERLGIRALDHGSRDAQRASKLARQAAGTAGTPEGETFLETLRVLLDTLGVVMPKKAMAALTDGARPALTEG